NLNDTNSVNGLPGQDQLAWAEVMVRDLQDSSRDRTFYLSASDDPFGISTVADELATGLADSIANGAPEPVPATDPVGTGDFGDTSGDGCAGIVFGGLTSGCDDTNGDFIPDDLEGIDSRWGYVHGQICVDDNGDIAHLGECNSAIGDPNSYSTVNQNLGANEVAFAIFNDELSELVNDDTNGYDVLSARILLSRIDNGFEQAFIRGVMFPPDDNGMPEPLTLGLVGIGFLGAGFARRRRQAAR
ncbi:MAG: PEP-CTERM sorting domain-containing protein, partial [Gammaproteobacteria bacterium]|nr:PEP-CTERM sorting domain-containing protein [Gammaproteobacteria bacterium]